MLGACASTPGRRAACRGSAGDLVCPAVCYEDYEDPFPHPAMCAPTPRERWSCASLRHAHAVCRDCDALVQSSANTALPSLPRPAPSSLFRVTLSFVLQDLLYLLYACMQLACNSAARLLLACYWAASGEQVACIDS